MNLASASTITDSPEYEAWKLISQYAPRFSPSLYEPRFFAIKIPTPQWGDAVHMQLPVATACASSPPVFYATRQESANLEFEQFLEAFNLLGGFKKLAPKSVVDWKEIEFPWTGGSSFNGLYAPNGVEPQGKGKQPNVKVNSDNIYYIDSSRILNAGFQEITLKYSYPKENFLKEGFFSRKSKSPIEHTEVELSVQISLSSPDENQKVKKYLSDCGIENPEIHEGYYKTKHEPSIVRMLEILSHYYNTGAGIYDALHFLRDRVNRQVQLLGKV